MGRALEAAVAFRALVRDVEGGENLRMSVGNYLCLRDLFTQAHVEYLRDKYRAAIGRGPQPDAEGEENEPPLRVCVDDLLPDRFILVDTPAGPVELSWDMTAWRVRRPPPAWAKEEEGTTS